MSDRPPARSLALPPPRDPVTVALWAAVACAAVWLYLPALTYMVTMWRRPVFEGADYSHGFLIPLVSLYAVWTRRAELAIAVRRRSTAGLVLVVVALAAHWAGLRSQFLRISLASFILLLFGCVLHAWGPAVARRCAFPCAYLIFCIPMNFLDVLSFKLRMLSTATASVLLNGLGIPVHRVGSALLSAGDSALAFDVADPCSGIRSLLAMAAVAAAYAHFTQPGLVRPWLLFAASLPIAAAANVVRITTVVGLAPWIGREAAVGFYHDYSGYVFFATAVLMMVGAGRLLHRGMGPGPQPAPRPPDGEQPARPGLRTPALTALLLIAVTAAAIRFTPPVTLDAEPDIALPLPDRAGAWQGNEVRYCQSATCGAEVEAPEAHPDGTCPRCGGPLFDRSAAEAAGLPPDAVLHRKRYANRGGPPLLVSVVVSGYNRKSIHRPQDCLVGQGYDVGPSRVIEVPRSGEKPLRVMVMDLVARRGTPGSTVRIPCFFAYWFVGGGRETPWHTVRLFWTGAERLFGGRASRWTYVSVAGETPPPPVGADRAELIAFLSELAPLIRRAPARAPVGFPATPLPAAPY